MSDNPNPDDYGEGLVTEAVRASESAPFSPDEIAQTIGQIYYLVKDEQVLAQLEADPHLKVLLPTLSHLLRTSRLSEASIKEGKLRWRRALRLQLLIKQRPTLVNMAKFDAWYNYGAACFDDTREGWRGKLATERIKTYKIEGSQPRKGFWGFLRR